jgi:hypothetical protein
VFGRYLMLMEKGVVQMNCLKLYIERDIEEEELP